MKDMLKKWKTSTCNVGAKCWCRLIVTVDYSEKNDIGECIIHYGSVPKELAKHFVELHNDWLKENKENG